MIDYPPERKNSAAVVRLRAVAFLFGAIVWFAFDAPAQTTSSVTLAWNPISDSSLAGYHVYQGFASGIYTNLVPAGNHTNTTISGLKTGVKYFFAVTTYTTTGLESIFSNEVIYTPSTNSVPAVTLTTPADGASYAVPASISLAASVVPNGHTITKVQFFSGSTLLAEDTAAPYTFTWSGVGAGSYPLSAKLIYDSSNTLASAAVNVTVASAPGSSLTFASTSGTITAPFVPSNGAIYQTIDVSEEGQAGITNGGRAVYSFNIATQGSYTVSASVNAPNSAAKSFWVNIDSMPTDPGMIWDNYPYTIGFETRTVSWRGNGSFNNDQYNHKVFNLTAGAHQLIIIGREAKVQLGQITISPTAAIGAPVLALTAPANGASYTAPASISLAASVIPNGHTITKVQFFSGSTLLAEDTAAPYTFTWSGVGAGSYPLSAKLIYDSSNTLASAAVNVTVASAPGSSLTFASTSGTITAPFVPSNGAIYQTIDVSEEGQAGITNGGRAVYSFNIATQGSYTVSASVNAPNSAAKSFWVNIDSMPTDPGMIWDNYPYTTGFETRTVSWRGNGSFNNDQYSPKVFNLTAGAHQLIIIGREAKVQLGTITITPATVLPPPWQTADIGNVGIAGSASVSAGSYGVAGSGNLTGSSDNFYFVYQPMVGDGDLRARVTSLQNTATNACAGVMMREALIPGSKYAFLGISPDGSLRCQDRTNTASGSSVILSGAGTLPNGFARLVRSSNSVFAYKSTDGVTWNLVASNSIAMATNIYFGLAVASGTTNALSTAVFTNVVAIP